MSTTPASSRFTAWLSSDEREGVRRLAGEQGSSENYVVRIAVRALLGLPVPRWALLDADKLSDELDELRLRELRRRVSA